MAYAYPPILSSQAARFERLARLAYELLDAHLDTEHLVRQRRSELRWQAHLSYLRDLHDWGVRSWPQIYETATTSTRIRRELLGVITALRVSET